MRNLEKAFEFLHELKSVDMEFLKAISKNNIQNIQLLAGDMLDKNANISEFTDLKLAEILIELDKINTYWNGSLQKTLDQSYRLIEQNSTKSAIVILNSFIEICPSTYYKSIASNFKDSLL
jgi:hypothetical protein